MIRKVVFIGAGNVATSLSKALIDAGFEVAQIFSRTKESAEALAMYLKTSYTTEKNKIAEADLYICSVKDDAIKDALSGINFNNKIVVHTSGSSEMDILKPFTSHYGVLYPMQTFTIGKNVDWSQVPVFIEANSSYTTNELMLFAKAISSIVTEADSKRRKSLHIAAVLVCNFTNHLYAMADRLLKENNLEFKTMLPLITETVEKVKVISPKVAQTGPASRHDMKVVNDHLSLLSGNDHKIYELISKAIQDEQL